MVQFLVAEQQRRLYVAVRVPEISEQRPQTASTEQIYNEVEVEDWQMDEDPVPASPSSDVLTEWMRETGWIEYCREHGFTLRQLHESAAELPDDLQGGRPPRPKILFNQCRGKVQSILDRMYRGGDAERRILCNFNIGNSALNGPKARRPLREETVKAHATIWARFVLFCVHVHHGDLEVGVARGIRPRNPDEPIVKLTREQGRLLDQLMDGQDVLVELSLSFIPHGPFQGNGHWVDFAVCD